MYDRRVLEEFVPTDPYNDGRVAVWPDVPTDSVDYIVVGEAPGKNEVKEGRIFVGEAGQLLREIEAEAGLSNVHRTNASLFRPTTGSKDNPPSPKLVRLERPRLLLEVSMLKPKAIIAVGATAWYALLGDQARMRGMVKEITIHGRTYPVYLTWHPAAVFYQPDLYVDVVTDFHRVARSERPAKALRLSPSPGLPPLDSPILSIDTEATHSHFPTAELLVCTLSDGVRYWAFDQSRSEELAAFLHQYAGRLVGHNVAGDEVLLGRYSIPARISDDTILLHLSQDERKGSHKLKTLAPVLGKVDTGIDWVWHHTHKKTTGEGDEEAIEWKDIPQEDLVPYCGQDSVATMAVFKELTHTADERTDRLYNFLRRTFRAFTDGTHRGTLVDQELLTKKSEEQEAIVEKLRSQFDFNPESNPQTVAAFQAAGYKIESVAKGVIAQLDGDLPRQYSEYRREYKLLTAFLRPLRGWLSEDGRVRPTVKIHGTDSGRTSYADPNLQQVPPALRDLFVAAPGYTFVGWDFKVHEVRGIAYYSRDPVLCDVLRDPSADPHQLIADRTSLPRQTAKHSLFGVAYGASPGKLVKQHGIHPRVAQKAFDSIKSFLPGLDAWKEEVWKQMYEVGYVETPYGRRRNFAYISDRTAHKAERIAVNFLVQSLCGDVALESAVAVYEELGYPPLIFVHDFNCIEVPEEKAEEIAKQCQEIAGAILPNKYVRFIPEIKIGRSWGTLHAYEEKDEEDEELG